MSAVTTALSSVPPPKRKPYSVMATCFSGAAARSSRTVLRARSARRMRASSSTVKSYGCKTKKSKALRASDNKRAFHGSLVAGLIVASMSPTASSALVAASYCDVAGAPMSSDGAAVRTNGAVAASCAA
jgi:hypothetical protein